MAAPSTPSVTTPYPVDNFSTNKAEQTIGGVAGAGTVKVMVLQRSDLVVTFDPVKLTFSFGVVLTEGTNTLLIAGVSASGEVSAPYRLQIVLTTDDRLTIGVQQPTGIVLSVGKDRLIVTWQGLPDSEVQGYNVRVSDQPAGGLSGYTLLTVAPVSSPYQTVTEKQVLSEQTTKVSDTEEVLETHLKLVDAVYYQYVDSKVLANGSIDSKDYYYVVTALKYDPIKRQEVESVYSAEVTGHVLSMTQQIELMPRSTQRDALVRMINSVYEAQPTLDVKPGTVARDLMDVVADEVEDVYTLLDFMQRAQSFITLLAIDDANGDGVSDEVSSSTYKQSLKKALNLTNDDDVQNIINNAFTLLASTFGVQRLAAQPAVVTCTFFVTSEPTQDLIVNINDVVASRADEATGTPEVRFVALERVVLAFATRDQHYDFYKQRWSIDVQVQAVTPGLIGNVAALAISAVVTGAVGFRVENQQAATSGQNEETNSALAERATLALAGIDTGTRYGYLRKALGVLGVQEAKVVASGDDLMYRDWDEVRKKHVGGKVDIYVQAVQYVQVVETVPFIFMTDQVSNASILSVPSMQFILTDDVFNTPGNELLKITKIFNRTRGVSYDLTGVKIIEPNVICLAMSAYNVQLGLATGDVIEVTYDRNALQEFVTHHQPIREVLSVLGDISGDLNNNYNLYKDDDSLWEGRSNKSQDRVQIFYSPSNGLPLNKKQFIVDERITMVSELRKPLLKAGVDRRTVVVTSIDKTITYRLGVDYALETDPNNQYITTIYRLIGGAIFDTSDVFVNYQAAENVQITYTYNQALENVAGVIQNFQHVTADVIIKESSRVSIDLITTIGLKPGVSKEAADPKVRSVLANNINSLKLGQSVHQSDVVGWIEGVTGVDYVLLPMTKMVRADQTPVIGEEIKLNGTLDEWERYETSQSIAYITRDPVLLYATVDGGGIVYKPPGRENTLYRFVAIYLDRQALAAQEDPKQVSKGFSRCYIRGDGRILVSLANKSDMPWLHVYSATYFAIGESGSKDIIVSEMEYPYLGTLVLNYKESASAL